MPCLAPVNPLNLDLFLTWTLVRDPRRSHARLRHIQLQQYAPHLSSRPHIVCATSAETPFWRTICTSPRRDDSRGHIREPQSLFLRNPLWNDLDFVPGRVKPHSTCSSYPTMSPPPISKLGYQKDFQITQSLSVQSLFLSPKVLRATVDFPPDFAHTHNEHQGDLHIQVVLRSSIDDQNDYPRGSTNNTDIHNTSIPSLRQGGSR